MEQKYRVYFADTDAGGVVYHGRYFNFAERSRTEFLRNIGFVQRNLATKNIFFVVHSADVRYIYPAFLDDLLTVCTKVVSVGTTSFDLRQEFFCDEKKLCEINVKIVCVSKKDDGSFFAIRMPDEIKIKLL